MTSHLILRDEDSTLTKAVALSWAQITFDCRSSLRTVRHRHTPEVCRGNTRRACTSIVPSGALSDAVAGYRLAE